MVWNKLKDIRKETKFHLMMTMDYALKTRAVWQRMKCLVVKTLVTGFVI